MAKETEAERCIAEFLLVHHVVHISVTLSVLHSDERKSKEAAKQKAFRDQNPDYQRQWKENNPGKVSKGRADGDEKTAAVRQDGSFEKR